MSKKPTKQEKVNDLFVKLCGDKVYKVTERAIELMNEGKSPDRAKADALEEFKLV